MPRRRRIVRHDLIDRIREIENVFIPMPDGCLLAARIWLPHGAERRPVPAILEFLPYRKRDFMRTRDEPIHRYFAGHGYAAVRVDVRGSGDSDGVLTDEYTRAEHDDAEAIIAWIIEQPWCSGAVGMMGISWGGFNALQVAARRPPGLEAVITMCASDDRYADDAHYMGGCLLNENLQWGAILMCYNALPPDPEIVGDRWREMWLERLDRAEPFPALWMRHPTRDAYWKHGSVSEDLRAIECPVYAIGGWADAYSNAVPRLVAGLSCPRKGLVGPWAHVFPHSGIPGPSIGFLQEAVRWWDQWLRGRETGIMDEPIYRAWMQESVRPAPQYDQRPGRWVAETSWPSPRIRPRAWHLNPGTLDDAATESVALSLTSPQTTGSASGEWCAFGSEGEMPQDQRLDDGRSLVFESETLGERIEILGAPAVELEIQSDAPIALVAVRLNDVAPDGASTRVTYGLFNLTHHTSREHPTPLEPGRRYRVRVVLNDIAHAFPPEHRIGLGISTSYWPMVWPSPHPVALTVHSGVSTLELPVRPPAETDGALRAFEPPEAAPGTESRPFRPLPFRRVVERDLTSNEVVYTLSSDGGEFGGHSRARIEEIDLELGYAIRKLHRIAETDPLSARSEVIQHVLMRREGWSVRIDGEVHLSSTRGAFRFVAKIEAREGDEIVRTRSWDLEIPRALL